ncbi:MAG: DUF4332 domain-containing protein [Chloroflexi bacterium]|nr:MAG: DUF4332 domain-containing protein [Chloroflexota bacterium]
MTRLIDIEGIGQIYAARLEQAGVVSIDDLLAKAGPAQGRAALAAAADIDPKLLLEWVNHADLMRLKGVGSEYADLLEAAGVDSCAELAGRNAANLHAKLGEANAEKRLVRRLPSRAEVEQWIAAAAAAEKVVTHERVPSARTRGR